MHNVKGKGFLIFALGHPTYGRLAYNLALTIKAVERDTKIAVVSEGRALNHLGNDQKEIFDFNIPLPDDVPKNCGAKLWGYQLTPFSQTVVLDADMLWLPHKKPSELFEQLEGIKFTAITESYWSEDEPEMKQHTVTPYYLWAEPKEIKEVYNVEGRIYQWRSEVMYFEKNQDVRKMFLFAQKVFAKPNLKTALKYATGTADELALNVACAVHKFEPHVFRWKVSYWDRLYGFKPLNYGNTFGEYYLASFGSNATTAAMQNFYNRVMKATCFKMGRQHVFPLQSKRDVIPERLKM